MVKVNNRYRFKVDTREIDIFAFINIVSHPRYSVLKNYIFQHLEDFIIKLIGGLIITVFLGNTAFSFESSQNIKEEVSTDVTILNT